MVYSSLFFALIVCVVPTESFSTHLSWNITDNSAALCNDFSRAGFFHRLPSHAVRKWVVFLESGSVCYSNETCNRRYFQSHLRDRYSTDVRGENLFGNFDTTLAWAETGAAGQPLTTVVNPLMTSTYCFRNETQFFSDSDSLSVEGRDILSSDCRENPTFCNHGHVLVPYCSSDLWLGSDERQDQQCDCWDQDCFRYNPTSEDLQFTFRGQTIFRSVLQTLDRLFNLKTASEIVLVGSSAGGVGVLNSAKWVRDTFPNVSLSVIADSSWFVNFRDNIAQEFGTLNSTSSSIFNSILYTNEACRNTMLGYPCCLVAECVLLESSRNSNQPYFPRDVPVFALTSIYDIFWLAIALARVVPVGNDLGATGLAIQFTTTVGEYGGAMNKSLIDTVNAAALSGLKLSYFTTQCFQHIYLSTSTLRKLLGSDATELTYKIAVFEHRIEPGVWNSKLLSYYNDKEYNIRGAIDHWYNLDSDESVSFREKCSGPQCSGSCPEKIALIAQDEAQTWSTGVRIALTACVVLIEVTCLIMKIYCCVWIRLLHRQQQIFLTRTASLNDSETPTIQRYRREFPNCIDENAISVACLDLYYNVTSTKKEVVALPVALTGLQEHQQQNMEAEGVLTNNRLGEKQRKNRKDTVVSKMKKMSFNGKTKKILSGISAYFNPGELVAIMGPSGCGKTTLLDLLTGRRKTGDIMGKVLVNGLPIEENQNWYISNTGYVLQLAAPYYEELTVRENLTLAAWVKLHISNREKFQRVEQVMEVVRPVTGPLTGLMDLADTVVGGATGPGLSGGQKRRLVVALQLLKLPSVIFLDEPTSGLDSASSTELLIHLNSLAASNRTVVLTIHQPRLEIFHMFHRIVVLTNGKIAYHGVPEKAYEVFVDALHSSFLSQGIKIPPLEDHNPADIIMDMLGDKTMREIVSKYYEQSGEPELVRKAVDKAWLMEQTLNTEIDGQKVLGAKLNSLKVMLMGNRHVGRSQNYSPMRLAALEVRAMKRANLIIILYLPVIFLSYGFLLGTSYFQTNDAFLMVSGFCVYSVASALFMFPALYTFFVPALGVYTSEHADGTGRATDLVIQPFVRFISMAFLPVIIGAGVLYVFLVDIAYWNIKEFLQILLVNFALNQAWTSLLIWLILAFPKKALRISPILSALAGFVSGFFIPVRKLPWWYRWMSFVNPNYYGFSASAVIILADFESDCERDSGSELECYTSSGDYMLNIFGFNTINPYENILILLVMTIVFLVLAGVCNWMRYWKSELLIHRIKVLLSLLTTRNVPAEPVLIEADRSSSSDSEEDQVSKEEEGEEVKEQSKASEEGPSQAKRAWKRAVGGCKQNFLKEEEEEEEVEEETLPLDEAQIKTRAKTRSIKDKKKALYTTSGQNHSVWTPRRPSIQQPAFTDIVMEAIRNKKNLGERQKYLQTHITATNMVLKVQREEFDDDAGEEGGGEDSQTHQPEKKRWQKAIGAVVEGKRVKASQQRRRSHQFHEAVSQCVDNMTNRSLDDEAANAIALQAMAQAHQAIKLEVQIPLPIKQATVSSSGTRT